MKSSNRAAPIACLAVLAVLALRPAPLSAQGEADAYHDATARELVARARATRGQQGAEIQSYTAVVSQRRAVMLRLPLRDRLLGRQESAMRVRWSRTGPTIVQRLASRSEDMGGVLEVGDGVDLSTLFDPDGDRIYFGVDIFGMGSDPEPRDSADSDGDSTSVSISISSGGVDADIEGEDDLRDFWIAHPLAEGSEQFYRYRSGDTLTVRLPDGREVRSVELNAIPRTASFHHLRASLWLEPESGALIQAIYRPARDLDIQRDTALVDPESVDDLSIIPGMFRPISFDMELITVEYGLWDMRHWLPRRMSMEGYVRGGVVRVPFEAEVAYRMEQVDDQGVADPLTPEQILASWGSEVPLERDTAAADSTVALVYAPVDERALLESEWLPPPVWDDAPEFASNAELEEFAERLNEMIPVSGLGIRPTLDVQYLLGGRGLIRYNRVEALSLGLRGVVDHILGRAHATVRLGAADLHPNAELGVLLPRSDFAWRIEGYHRLTTVEPGLPAFEAPPPALGLGNSLGAFLFGRDDGQYYRATGGFVALEPLPANRQWWRVALFAERHDAASRKVEWNLASWLDSDREFRPNLAADEVDLAGASIVIAPWFGVGDGPQAGLELFGEGAAGDSTFARARLTARTILPLRRGWRLGLEGAAGHAWGGTPVQYDWFLGGPTTLRGYDGGVTSGESMARTRAELALGAGALGLSLFTDAGWTGRREDFDTDDALLSVGLGFTLMDGVMRVDVAQSLRSPRALRLHLYLDALL